MKTKALVATLVVASMMLLPSAAAVHGSPYVAVGIAYRNGGQLTEPTGWLGPLMQPADGEVYQATVEWTGWWTRSFVVTITDIATGENLVNAEFPGMEQWGCCYWFGTEVFEYHGCTAGVSGWNRVCVDDPDFDVYGVQVIHVQTQQTMMLYSGWYQDWALYLVVEGHVDDLFA